MAGIAENKEVKIATPAEFIVAQYSDADCCTSSTFVEKAEHHVEGW